MVMSGLVDNTSGQNRSYTLETKEMESASNSNLTRLWCRKSNLYANNRDVGEMGCLLASCPMPEEKYKGGNPRFRRSLSFFQNVLGWLSKQLQTQTAEICN